MASKVMISAIFMIVAVAACSAGIIPVGVAPAAYIAPYASSYNAHVVNHAYATPVVAAAPLIAAPAAYASYPYSAYTGYNQPLIVA